MSTGAKRHVHKYFRIMMGDRYTWACGDPDCTHFIPLNMVQAAMGKASQCWECGGHTILSPRRVKIANEHNETRILCDDCIDVRLGLATREQIKERKKAIAETFSLLDLLKG